MKTAEAIAILSDVEATERLLARGWVRETCGACSGLGHFTVVADDATDWQKYACDACGGAKVVWRAPISV